MSNAELQGANSPIFSLKIELANKIRNGRAVGNLYGVGRYLPDGRRSGYALEPQESEQVARDFCATGGAA